MNKVTIILCFLFAVSYSVAENSSRTKKNNKTVESVASKKQAVEKLEKKVVNIKQTNWSKIKDLFM